MDEVLLTSIGQSQLKEVTLGFDSDDIFNFEDDELNEFGFYEVVPTIRKLGIVVLSGPGLVV